MSYKAVQKYREAHKDDPDYIERTRESNRKTSATYRQNIKNKSPEEYEAYRAKERERLRRWRAAKKAEQQAKQENGNEKTET